MVGDICIGLGDEECILNYGEETCGILLRGRQRS